MEIYKKRINKMTKTQNNKMNKILSKIKMKA